MPSLGVVIVTHNARHLLKQCLEPILQSNLHPKILVMNSSSQDGTVELAREIGVEVFIIPRSEFNHGISREKARKEIGTEIVVMMTPDAIAASPNFLEYLIAPIVQKRAAVSYARQLPHDGAGHLEAFPRLFNYPERSQIRSKQSDEGVFTIFCSNSCAAYDTHALDEVGGFTETLLGEDTFTTAKLLNRGYNIAYVAEAKVQHSHAYTLKQEFQRSFDTGLARRIHADLLTPYGRDTKRGLAFYFSLIRYLWKNSPVLIPYATVQTAMKYLGYRIGRWAVRAPIGLKRRLSSQDFYWNGD